MRRCVTILCALGGIAAGWRAARAQGDYYNLDGGRPGRVEDGVPTPRRELELQLFPLRAEHLTGGLNRWRAEPKLSYGILRFTELELRAPIVTLEGTSTQTAVTGLAGLGVGALHAFNLEAGRMPALALAGEISLPVGPLAATKSSWLTKAIATKTFPLARVHLNAGLGTYSLAAPRPIRVRPTCGSPGLPECPPPPVYPPDPPCVLVPDAAGGVLAAARQSSCLGGSTGAAAARAGDIVSSLRGDGNRWVVGVGFDRALPLESTLLFADLVTERYVELYDRNDWTAEVGLRRQLTPQLVIDAGIGRRFIGTILSTSATLGFSYGMPVRVPVRDRPAAAPAAPGARVPYLVRGSEEQTYLPRGHNWAFRRRYPGADRLFNAFDYGHAILYETLIADGERGAARLDGATRRFVVEQVLTRGQPVPLEERAVGPRYATLAPELIAIFEWAHQLHRQIYDVWADEWLGVAQKDSAVAELVRYYRSRADLALSSRPKSMELMEGQPYSLAFRRASPQFNGLIWSYHWLQMALYDALMEGPTVGERQRFVDSTLAHFRTMAMSGSPQYPTVMPMAAAVAPAFSTRYPEAAAIFDNLHSLHDVAADILATTTMSRRTKRAAILAAAARYRDDVTEVTTREEWVEMARSMGVENMGGVAVPRKP